ncbi:MAG: FKBP-type peptidyl-prolyl cis-trans isomerase [Candidatus Nanopelagicales bacterium]
MTRRPALAAAAALLAPVLVLTACSSSGTTTGATSTPSSSSAAPESSSAEPTESGPTGEPQVITVADVSVQGAADQPPLVQFPVPATATELTTADVVEGKGKEAAPDSTITFNYVGIGAETGTTFDSSFDRGEPLTYPLTGLIPGWQEGIPGMKEGGRRVLVIPGELAYGANPPTPDILPNETLIFVIDLVSIP